MNEEKEHILLKWGTLKGWRFKSEATKAIMQRYLDLGTTLSAMAQRDTEEQKKIICELIDAVDGPIQNDFSGEIYTKEEAKNYILTYGSQSS